MHIGIGGRRVGVLILACAALLVGVLALDGPLDDEQTTTIEASQDASVDAADPAAEPGTTATQPAENPSAEYQTGEAAAALEVATNADSPLPTAALPATSSATATSALSDTTAEQTGTTAAGSEPTTTTAGSASTLAPSSADGKPVIHLTFDDGPSEITPRVMDLVEQYGGRATFFVMGSAVEDHPDIARQIVERGHAIANHSYAHMDWRQAGAREDAIRTQEIIKTATGVTPSCARPPFGAQDENLLSILSSLGMTSWRWDLSAEDHTVARNRVEETLNTIEATQNIRGAEGKIFLQHDSDLLLGPSIDGLESWLAKNGDRFAFKVIDNCTSYQ